MKIGIILLAAGASRRMGRPKQLLPFRGKSLIQHICGELLKIKVEEIVVVLGANDQKIRPELSNLPVKTVWNPNGDNGMGGSIATGVSYFKENDLKIDAFLIVLCDQPFLTAKYLKNLTKKTQEAKKGIAASTYANTVGVPAFFHQKYTDDLLALKEQGGAKKLFQKYKNDLLSIPFPQGEFDLDTPEDYERFGK